jgi:hypothetical protein
MRLAAILETFLLTKKSNCKHIGQETEVASRE